MHVLIARHARAAEDACSDLVRRVLTRGHGTDMGCTLRMCQAAAELKRLTSLTIGAAGAASQGALNRQQAADLLSFSAGACHQPTPAILCHLGCAQHLQVRQGLPRPGAAAQLHILPEGMCRRAGGPWPGR